MDSTVPQQTQVAFCWDCGAPLEPGSAFCGNCGCPVAKAKAFPVFNVVRIAIAVVLIIAAVIMVGKGNDILNSDNMKFYKEHLQSCEEGREDCRVAMYQASGYYYSLYKDLVDTYDDMIADDKEEIREMKSEANTFFIVAGVCAAAAVAAVVVPWKRVFKNGAKTMS